MCEGETEIWEHVWERCRRREEEERSNWQEALEWVLGKEGEGEWWLRELENWRREVEDRRRKEGKGGWRVRERERGMSEKSGGRERKG